MTAAALRLWLDPSSDLYQWASASPACWWADVTDYVEHRAAASLDGLDEPAGVPVPVKRSTYYDAA